MPYICGSFNGWRYQTMQPIDEFIASLQTEPTDYLDLAQTRGLIRRTVTSINELTAQELNKY